MIMKILISSCLLGFNTKYNGKNNLNKDLEKLKDKYEIIIFCPEQAGGLTTPRLPSEIQKDGRVLLKDSTDVTKNFIKGAEETVRLVEMMDIKYAILKAKSPSCGCGKIYDGTFSGNLIDGDGFTVRELKKLGVKIFNENNFQEFFSV